MHFHKSAALATVVLAAGVSLTACNGNGTASASGSAGSGDVSASASASAGNGASGGQSSGTGAQPASGSNSSGSGSGGSSGSSGSSKCLTSNLAIAVKSSGPASNGPYIDTEFRMTNKGSGSCVMRGYPGVDLVTNYGTLNMSRTANQQLTTVTLSPGQSTTFTLLTTPNNSGGSGVRATAAKVTPPNETHSATVPLGLNLPVTDGSNSDSTLGVSPVGE